MGFESLSKVGKLHTLSKDSVLCREGEDGETAFIVLSGAVRVVLNSFSANPYIVTTLMPGSFVGEMSLFLKHKRTATVITVNDNTSVLEIGMDNFKDYLKEDAATCFKLMKSLTNRVDGMLEKVGKIDKKFEYKFRSNSYYQLAHQLFQSQFAKLVSENADGAIALITFLCSSLKELNDRFLDSENHLQ
ncbi:MAG: cyclic nucleotide-binding domain-containing protein [Lachnospiraceae bacterium]|nr:cyclic nucleotide-binding domain-containing protein [Lachnospiraceae bacterium]